MFRPDRILREILDDESLVVSFKQLEAHPTLHVVAGGEEIEQLLVVQLQIRHADGELRA